jgi:acyl-coenzyme A synthetase/AMP-(fatty) acid ligase
LKFFLIDYLDSKKISWDDFFDDLKSTKYFYSTVNSDDYYSLIKTIVLSFFEEKTISLIDGEYHKSSQDKVYNNRNHDYPTNFDELLNFFQKPSRWEVILYTSGTTGKPKKTVHTFKSLNRFIFINESYRDDIWGLAYSPTHIAGLQVIFQSLLNYNTMVRLFGLKPHQIHKQFRENNITHISATPTFYRMNLPLDTPAHSVKRVSLGGEPFNIDAKEIISKSFPSAKITNIYASTEYGTLFASSGELFTIKDKYKKTVRIVSDQIEVHKSLINLSKPNFNGDWYKTGDMVEFGDSDTNFKIIGRKNDLVNVGGLLVNISEIENELLKIEGIKQCKVYARENALIGNLIVCDIVLNMLGTTKKLILTSLSSKLPKYKIPRIINFVPNISLTTSGKIKR